MRPGNDRRWATVLAAALLVLSGLSVRADDPAPRPRSDEPRGLGRLFRFGRSNRNPPAASRPPVTSSRLPGLPEPSTPATGNAGLPAAPPPLIDSAIPAPAAPTAPTTRIVPQPRVNRAVTESDPILTYVSIGRADDGKQFSMFVQLFADGTVFDSVGIHHVGPDVLRPVVQVIQNGDFGRLRGHCGGPPTDYIEQVHVIVYDRYLGKLRAHNFSYSGNPQGCDPAVRQLQTAVDNLQAKISGPPIAAPAPAANPPANIPSNPPAGVPENAPATSAPAIPLTPVE